MVPFIWHLQGWEYLSVHFIIYYSFPVVWNILHPNDYGNYFKKKKEDKVKSREDSEWYQHWSGNLQGPVHNKSTRAFVPNLLSIASCQRQSIDSYITQLVTCLWASLAWKSRKKKVKSMSLM